MRLIFVSKCSKFNVYAKNKIKLQQNISGFLDMCIYTGRGKFSILSGEYSYSTVNVLTSSPEVSDPTKNDYFQLSLAQNDKKVR